MRIVVCLKRVVDTETRVKPTADGRGIELSGVQFITAPYDEMAVEKAIQLRDAAGSGEVVVLTVGPEAATKELRTALAMGADAALHVVDDAARDASSISAALAAAIEGRSPDLVLLGKQATDDDDAAVGPMLAARLGLPCVAFVDGLEIDGSTAKVRREIDGEVEHLVVSLPAVFTAQKGLAEARYPGLKGIMAAKKKPLEQVAVTAPSSHVETTGLRLPPPRGQMVTIEATEEGMQRLLVALRNEKKVI